jgi:hypothetical protein
MECLRRFLQHVLPEGFMKVRPFGFLHASCALSLATIRLLIGQGHPREGQPPQRTPRNRWRPAVRPVGHLWASLCVSGPPPGPLSRPAERHGAPLTSVGRHGLSPQRHPCAHMLGSGPYTPADTGSAPTFQRLAYASRDSAQAPMVRLHTNVRHMPPPLS